MTRAEYEQKYGKLPSSVPAPTSTEPVQMTHSEYMAKYGGQESAQPVEEKSNPLKQLATGLGSSIIGTAHGIGNLLGLKPTALGERILQSTENTDKGGFKTAGKIVGDVAQLAGGVGEISAATKALPTIAKVAAKAAGSGAIVSAQQGKIGLDTAIAAGTEGLAPVAGAVLKPVGRLVKALASGVSGASTKALESIAAEGAVSKATAKIVDSGGASSIIQKNAETVINGVSKIKKEARAAFAEGVTQLKATDINPKLFRSSVSQTLDKYGSEVKNGVRKLTTAEFDTPAMVKKANTLVNKLSTTPLDGASLNRLQNEIDAAAFKITGADPQRLAFNAFVHDLSGSIRTAIGQSTDKLKAINKAFSSDMQIAEAMEGIFGKVKFKSLNEIRKVSQQLETLFNKKGISPEIIDRFLTRVGVKPSEFRATEAVRQISDKEFTANSVGTNVSELVRGVTSAVVTPQFVRNLAIKTGIAEQTLVPILQKLAPAARATVVRLLVEAEGKLNQ